MLISRLKTSQSVEKEFFLDKGNRTDSFPLLVWHCGLTAWGAGCSLERRRSAFYSFELVTSGDVYFTQFGYSQLVCSGQVFLKHAHERHKYSVGPSGYAFKKTLRLSGWLLESFMRESKLKELSVLPPSISPVFNRLHRSAYQLLGSPNPDCEQLSIIAYELLRNCTKTLEHFTYPTLLQMVIKCMKESIQTKRTIPEIAKLCHTNQTKVNRVFKQYLNQAPLHYYTSLRLEVASEALKFSKMNVTEVAKSIGEEDPFYFSTLFKKWYNHSPLEFRKLHVNARYSSR